MGSWICDDCGELIEKEEDGWVEWMRTPDEVGRYRGHGLRLVHHTGKRGCQYDGPALHARDGSLLSDLDLGHFLGPDGLMQLLCMIHDDDVPTEEALEMIKRLHVPHYEQARPHLERAISEGLVEPNTAPRYLWQSQLRAIAEEDWT